MHAANWNQVPRYLPGERVAWNGKQGRVKMRGNNSGELLVKLDNCEDVWTTDEEIWFGRGK